LFPLLEIWYWELQQTNEYKFKFFLKK
jgi:hypothetical protein